MYIDHLKIKLQNWCFMTKYKSLSAEILSLAKRVDIQQIEFLLLFEHFTWLSIQMSYL